MYINIIGEIMQFFNAISFIMLESLWVFVRFFSSETGISNISNIDNVVQIKSSPAWFINVNGRRLGDQKKTYILWWFCYRRFNTLPLMFVNDFPANEKGMCRNHIFYITRKHIIFASVFRSKDYFILIKYIIIKACSPIVNVDWIIVHGIISLFDNLRYAVLEIGSLGDQTPDHYGQVLHQTTYVSAIPGKNLLENDCWLEWLTPSFTSHQRF